MKSDGVSVFTTFEISTVFTSAMFCKTVVVVYVASLGISLTLLTTVAYSSMSFSFRISVVVASVIVSPLSTGVVSGMEIMFST